MTPIRRLLGLFSVVGLLALAGAAQGNTLLLVADDLGVDGISTYKEGKAPAPTPNIDALARSGVLFRNAYAYPSCSATRATFHTGRYGFRTGVGRAGRTLPLSEHTLPEILAKGGYANACIGKWHLGGNKAADNHPNQTGWSHFSGSLPAFFRGNDTYFNWRKVVNGKASTSKVYSTTDNVNDGLTWIKAQTKPWVCVINFNAPHTPLHAPPSSLHTYNLQGKTPSRQPLPFFKAMVEAVDTEIGRLLKSMDAKTLAATDVIFVGDNGTGSRVSEPPFASNHAKFTIYEGGTNVPLIISGPTVKSPGREVKSLVSTADLFHTIAELSGIDARTAVPATVVLDGVSMVPYLRNPNQSPLREFVYTEQFGTSGANQLPGMTLRNDRYKLIRFTTSPSRDEFYDLQVDPFEKSDLLAGKLSSAQKYNRDLLSAEMIRLHGGASWFAFGAGCKGTAGTPVLAAKQGQLPRLGQTFTTQVSNIGTSNRVFGVIGVSNEVWGPLKLPYDLGPIKMPGCQLLASAEVVLTLPASGGTATWSLSIPNDNRFLGGRLFQQALVLDPKANGTGVITSNAGRACVERK